MFGILFLSFFRRQDLSCLIKSCFRVSLYLLLVFFVLFVSLYLVPRRLSPPYVAKCRCLGEGRGEFQEDDKIGYPYLIFRGVGVRMIVLIAIRKTTKLRIILMPLKYDLYVYSNSSVISWYCIGDSFFAFKHKCQINVKFTFSSYTIIISKTVTH